MIDQDDVIGLLPALDPIQGPHKILPLRDAFPDQVKTRPVQFTNDMLELSWIRFQDEKTNFQRISPKNVKNK